MRMLGKAKLMKSMFDEPELGCLWCGDSRWLSEGFIALKMTLLDV